MDHFLSVKFFTESWNWTHTAGRFNYKATSKLSSLFILVIYDRNTQ